MVNLLEVDWSRLGAFGRDGQHYDNGSFVAVVPKFPPKTIFNITTLALTYSQAVWRDLVQILYVNSVGANLVPFRGSIGASPNFPPKMRKKKISMAIAYISKSQVG